MLQVDDRFEVAAPRAEVFRQWTAFERFPLFMTGVESVYLETQVRMRWRVSIAGVEPTFYAVITEHVPDERIAWMSVDQTTMGWWIDLEELDADRTLVTLRVISPPRAPRRGSRTLRSSTSARSAATCSGSACSWRARSRAPPRLTDPGAARCRPHDPSTTRVRTTTCPR